MNAMSFFDYPDMITSLPEADIPVDGVRAWIFQGTDSQIVFFDIDPIGKIPEHTHGEQWGFVIQGEMILTVDGVSRRVRAGESYHITAHTPHSAEFISHFKAMDIFADPDRYKAKSV
jgi:quercetin dioxygenase-like cupin family protein